MVKLATGTVLLVNEVDASGAALNTVEVFDPLHNLFTPIAKTNQARAHAQVI